MGKALAIFILGVLGSFSVRGQIRAGQPLDRAELPPVLTPPPMLGVVSMSSTPLLLLGSQETSYGSLLVDPKEIIVVQVYKDSAVLAEMGRKAQNGVVQITLKNKKPLLKLEDVLDYFEVPPAQRQLRVLVNKHPVNSAHFLADLKRIAKVEVITQDKITPYRLSWDENEQFLNIVTVQQSLL
ncbi:hypothetical protein ACFSC6_11725 [Rufibacter sediminis]|uniref:Uncharacterized protein n=1 Tax=Rufibacter sediminis TaxID=2762756 RepID=A0ABR6VUH9_9BACT|nr:hypothetical protein [Rufibacter sediminis]MBC3540549.1 hypothetical protein [Rufibacter sediminis]